MVVEDDALQRSGAYLPILTEAHGDPRKSVWLSGNVDSVVVRLGFLDANDAVADWRRNKKVD